MKKLLFILPFILCGCATECIIAQIPPQTIYINADCSATLPDYRAKITVTDNCQIKSIVQLPAPGVKITGKTLVTITATDVFGNFTEASFNVTPVDTIPPVILYNETSAEADNDAILKMYERADAVMVEYQTWWNNQFPWDSLEIARNDTMNINYKLVMK